MPEELTGLSAQLVEVGAALHARFPEIIALYLFGSRAEGNAQPDSDIDLAVLTAPAVPCTPQRFFAYYAPMLQPLQSSSSGSPVQYMMTRTMPGSARHGTAPFWPRHTFTTGSDPCL